MNRETLARKPRRKQAPGTRRWKPNELAQEVEWLLEHGSSAPVIATQLDMLPASIANVLSARADPRRPDLAAPFYAEKSRAAS